MQLPQMAPVKQHFASDSLADVAGEVRRQLARAGLADSIAPGARIAVTGGSRGIANIPLITRTVVDCVKEAGGSALPAASYGQPRRCHCRRPKASASQLRSRRREHGLSGRGNYGRRRSRPTRRRHPRAAQPARHRSRRRGTHQPRQAAHFLSRDL